MLFFIYLTLNGLETIFYRKNKSKYQIRYFRRDYTAEIISSILILTGIIGIFVLIKKTELFPVVFTFSYNIHRNKRD